jgi:RNA polymerase-binding transcription factor DksA
MKKKVKKLKQVVKPLKKVKKAPLKKAVKVIPKKIKTLPKAKLVVKEKEKKVKKIINKFKKTGKTRYSSKELQHFKDIILKERKLILESAEANMKALVDSETGEYAGDNLTYATHMAEQGTDEMEREKNYLFVQRDEKYLGYLQEALSRIDQGTYGVCIDCFDEPKYLCKTCPLIPRERLELVPITQHCIECKNLRG